MRSCVYALMASAALFVSSGAFMMTPSSLPPAVLSSSCHLSASPVAVRSSFGRLAPPVRSVRRVSAAGSTELRMGILDDILARKKKEVEALKANLPDDAAALLEKGVKKNKNTFMKSIKKPKGTISVMGQMKIRSPQVGQFSEIPAPDFLSAHMYEAGAAACVVCCDEEAYGLNYQDLASCVKQQVHDPLPLNKYPMATLFHVPAILGLSASQRPGL